MTEECPTRTSRQEALARVREGQAFVVDLPLLGRVGIPPPDQLAYFGGLAVLAVLEIIDWPVAVALAAGHIMASNHHNRIVEELGVALEEA